VYVRVAARNEAGRGEWSQLSATPIIPALTSMQYNASSLHAGDTFSLRLSFMYAPSHTCNLSCRAIFDIEFAILLVLNANVASPESRRLWRWTTKSLLCSPPASLLRLLHYRLRHSASVLPQTRHCRIQAAHHRSLRPAPILAGENLCAWGK